MENWMGVHGNQGLGLSPSAPVTCPGSWHHGLGLGEGPAGVKEVTSRKALLLGCGLLSAWWAGACLLTSVLQWLTEA